MKRIDNKKRELWTGEYQRSDGKYEYRYVDAKGIKRSVYSWTLKPTDKPPKGKEKGPCLRELEAQIAKDRQDGIDTFTAKKKTLNEFFDVHIKDRQVKDSTRSNYKYMYKRFVWDDLGQRPLTSIKYTDIRRFYNSLINEKGLKPSSMEIIHTILSPIFTGAVRDGYMRLNPTDGVMTEIKNRHDWEKIKRLALTCEQQKAFVEYVSLSDTYRHWLPMFTLFLGTGCRVGEILGLRWQDCSFDDGIIRIDHTLIYRINDDGECGYRITSPKTKKSIREIPMFAEVKEALEQEYLRQMKNGFNQAVIDGYSGFIFMNRYGSVLSPASVNRAIKRICKEYNVQEISRAQQEGRNPILLPEFSAHHLRHTFCTRLCENTSDKNTMKMIQEIMGHSSISITYDIYTDLTREKKQEAFAELQGKLRIA